MCAHEMITQVTWIKPKPGFIKLNTDGSALGNPRIIGAGGILRDYMGKFLFAYTIPLREGTNKKQN